MRPHAHYIAIIRKHVICDEDSRHKHNKHRKTDTKKRTAVGVTLLLQKCEPLVFEVARADLSAPCEIVDSERLFSAASHLLEEK